MRFFLIFTKKSVPEWQQCYYDYANIKSLIVLAKKAYAIRCNIEDLAREDNYSLQENTNLTQNRQALNEIRMAKTQQIQQIIEKANFLFYKYHSINKRVVFLFCQFKIHQLNAKVDKYNQWDDKIVQNKPIITQLFSNCYAQNVKLENMTQLHLQAYQKVHKKHEKAYKLFGLTTPNIRTARLARTLQTLEKFSQKLDKSLDYHQQVIHRQTKSRLQEQVQSSPFKVSMMSYLFGLCNGFSVCVLITAIILLGINIGSGQDPSVIQKRQMFTNQYRLWKSTGFVILYMWVFGIAFYIFQRMRINYNLIFDYKKKTKKSLTRLGSATFVSLLWCCMFIFYTMDLLDIYQVANVSSNPQLPITIFFPIMIFGLFILYFIVEFIRTRRGTIFFIFTVFKIIATPFGFFQITFGVIWATEQLLSLVQLGYDLAYSICYYSRILHTPTISEQDNPCLSFIIMVEISTIVIYTIRFFQTLRIARGNGKFWLTREMFRIIRASTNITLASLSISARTGRWGVLWAWLALGIIGAIYSFVIDVLLDWNIFTIEQTPDGKYKLVRRQQSIFPIRSINFMIACNLIGRLAYPITFSPTMMFSFVNVPELIITIAGVIELGRRLIWNLLRVQNQQIKNNYFFQIRTDYEAKQRIVKQELGQLNLSYAPSSLLEKERQAKSLQTLRSYIRQKNKLKQEVMAFQQKNDKLLQQIEEGAEQEIFKLVGEIR